MPKTKLQITIAILILGAVAGYSIFNKYPDIAAGCTGGIIALGMKLLEHNTPMPPTPPSA